MTAGHVAIPADLWSRTCATCGEPLEAFVDRFGEQWRHVAPIAAAPVQDGDGGRVCSICGEMARTGYVVEPMLCAIDLGIWARGPKTAKPDYRTMPACRNRQACRNRVESRGGAWPIVEGEAQRTVPYTGPRHVTPAPATSAEPDPLDAFG